MSQTTLTRKWATSAGPTRIPSAAPTRIPSAAPTRLKSALKRPPTARNDSPQPLPTLTNEQPYCDRLSGRVFMRKTIRKGWVARGVDSSKTDLEDDLSDDGSLDSFFDDDFEEDTQDEALGKLLSCNTLGVEAKGRKADWRAGELMVPEFHCPRCRDHWYGLSAFPCDEELARLIREGLWHTGREGTKVLDKRTDSARGRNRRGGQGSTTSLEVGSHDGLHSTRKGGFEIKKSDHNIDFIDPNSIASKRKKRISFAIDGKERDGSSTNLMGVGDDSKDGRGRHKDSDTSSGQGKHVGDLVLEDIDEGTLDGARKNTDSSSASDVNSGSSATLLHGRDNNEGTTEEDGTSGALNRNSSGLVGGWGEADHMKGRRRGKGDGEDDDDDIDGDTLGDRGHNHGNNGGRNLGDQGNSRDRNHDNNKGAGNDEKSLLHADNSTGRLEGHNSTGNESNDAGAEREDDGKWRNRRRTGSQTSSRFGSRTSLDGKKGGQRGRDSSRGDNDDIIRGKGHMRAATLSQSEWGEPTHALRWASNTASSSRVSLAPSGGNRDDTSDPLVHLPPIHRKMENPFASSSLLGAIELTRAFTFSYH